MKLTITHLKAPWPAGAVVGDVIKFAEVPAWALGKCVPAADDAEVPAWALGKCAPHDGGAPVTIGVVQAAPAEQEPNMDDLRAQAKALGIKVDGRWSVDRLAAEIEKAKSE